MSLSGNTNIFIRNFHSDSHFLVIEWNDGLVSRFPFIYLHDNAPHLRHINGQKLIETSSLDIDKIPQKIDLSDDDTLWIEWDNGGKISTFTKEWLVEHDISHFLPVQLPPGPSAKLPYENLWDRGLMPELPVGDFSEISIHNDALVTWLTKVKDYGFALLKNVPERDGAVLEVIKLFGYVRETNYGRLFDVKTIIDPNNLAYTNFGIGPHTDNPYRHPVPTLQLLHCLKSSARGGDSIVVDGFKVAENLREQYPDYFRWLSSVIVTFRFRDKNNWLEHTAPVISVYPNGSIERIRFNNRSVQPFRLPADDLYSFYEAYLCFARMLEEAQYQVRFRMLPGDLYVVDNERVLHARTSFDNESGERWLQGAYADKDSLYSKCRVLLNSH
jgi:gamma-butyrobetaine dioxygenase